MTPRPIPHPDVRVPEYDAPPPLPYKPGSAGFKSVAITPVSRPANRNVVNPSEKAVPGTMPTYHAPGPATKKK
jgi:hypothetical protein